MAKYCEGNEYQVSLILYLVMLLLTDQEWLVRLKRILYLIYCFKMNCAFELYHIR